MVCGFQALDEPGLQFHLEGSPFCFEALVIRKKQQVAPLVLSPRFHDHLFHRMGGRSMPPVSCVFRLKISFIMYTKLKLLMKAVTSKMRIPTMRTIHILTLNVPMIMMTMTPMKKPLLISKT
jgi:hypothetical protein